MRINVISLGAAVWLSISVGCSTPADQTAASGAPTPPDGRAAAARQIDPQTESRIEQIHGTTMFADLHAHPSYIHRGNAERISAQELSQYRRGRIDVVVAAVTPDSFYSGNFYAPDGTYVDRRQYRPAPGEVFAFTTQTLGRIKKTVDSGDAALATSPAAVQRAKANGQVSLLAALEGADGLDGDIEKLRLLHREHGVRWVQLVHLRPNGLGRIQTYPFTPGGLTDFGKAVVAECNKLGMIIDLAHANEETQADALALSKHPVIFSHTGIMALVKNHRHLTDGQIKAIAAGGGVIGIWPNAGVVPRVADMVDHIDYVKKLVGIDAIGIGSDLRGLDSQGYSEGFGKGQRPEIARGLPVGQPEDVDFLAIADALFARGYTNEEVGKIMGGNFFRVWSTISGGTSSE